MSNTSRWLRHSLIWLAGVCLAACTAGPTAPPVEVTRIVEVTAPPRTLRIAFASEPDFGDLPSLMALSLLAEQGYAVLPTNFAAASIAVEALARGDDDVGLGGMRNYWAAVNQGAGLITVAEQVANIWLVYASPDVAECADLDGKRLAISGENSLSAAMTRVYIQEKCPGAEPQIVLIQGSSNRAAALLSGEVDATPVELADAIALEQEAPGQFHVLTNFGHDLPDLKVTGIQFNREFAAQHPEAVEDYLAAVLTVHRQIQQDHDLLAAEASKRLALDPDIVPDIAEAYFAINAWDANGGLTEADVQYTLKFFTESGDLEPGLTVSDVADLSYLDSALAKIGRQN